MRPTILYPNLINGLLQKIEVKGMAHITGGGITENIPRIIPKDLNIDIIKDSWEYLEIFKWLKDQGEISEVDMFRIFNCGIGMTLIINPNIKDETLNLIKNSGYKAYHIGNIHNKESKDQVSYI